MSELERLDLGITLLQAIVNKSRHKGLGREPWLTLGKELCIFENFIFLAQCGYSFDHSGILNLIYAYLSYPSSRESPSGRKLLGTDFLRNFEK